MKMLIDETIELVKQIKGSAKAVTLQTDKIYIEIQKIENGVSLVEEEMEKMGIVGPQNGAKPREIIGSKPEI